MWRNYILKIRGNGRGDYIQERLGAPWEKGKNGTLAA